MALGVGVEMYPRFWDTMHSDNAYDDAFLDDGSINPERQLKVQTNNMESLANFELDQMIDVYTESSDAEEMLALSHQMLEFHHNYASFVPGFVQDFYRIGYWRWVKYPEFFNHRTPSLATELHVHWIDTELKEQTLAARAAGETFEPQIRVFDQYRVQ